MLLKNKNYKKEMQEYKAKSWEVMQKIIDKEIFVLTYEEMLSYNKTLHELTIKRLKDKSIICFYISIAKDKSGEYINPYRKWRLEKWNFWCFVPLSIFFILLFTIFSIVWTIFFPINFYSYLFILALPFICIAWWEIQKYIKIGLKYKKKWFKILAENGIYKPKKYFREKHKFAT